MATPKSGDPVCALHAAARPTQPSILHEAQEMASDAKRRRLREETLPANEEKAPEDEDGAQDEDSQKLDAWLDNLLAKASPKRAALPTVSPKKAVSPSRRHREEIPTTAIEWRRLREEIPTTALDAFDNLLAALSKRAASQLASPLQAASPTREAAPPKTTASPQASPKPKRAASPYRQYIHMLRCRWQRRRLRAAGEEHRQRAAPGSIGTFAAHYPPKAPAKKAIFDAIKREFSDSKEWAKAQNILWKTEIDGVDLRRVCWKMMKEIMGNESAGFEQNRETAKNAWRRFLQLNSQEAKDA